MQVIYGLIHIVGDAKETCWFRDKNIIDRIGEIEPVDNEDEFYWTETLTFDDSVDLEKAGFIFRDTHRFFLEWIESHQMADFRFTLKDRDGSIVSNRKADRDYYYYNGRLHKEFLEYSIGIECKEQGVILISYKEVENGIEGLVKYPNEK